MVSLVGVRGGILGSVWGGESFLRMVNVGRFFINVILKDI